MRELVSDLSRFDLKQGVSPEQAAKWKKDLKKVIEQGAAAVPAIAEFLERNMDLDFAKIPGGDALGYASLRQSLFDSLKQIGGPEALETMVATLRTTADPVEIVALARALEPQAPEQMRLALEAAREALAMAGQGKLANVDVSPLFQLFEKYGGPEVVADLEKASAQWHYYATMALADLPEGVGIPALMQLAQDPNAKATGSSAVATRLLAQMTLQYPEAQNDLEDQVRSGQIPDSAWQGIGLALGGVRLQYGKDQFPGEGSATSWTHYVVIGNQSFATVPALGSYSSDQIQQQLGFIDRLLLIDSLSPLARENLVAARAKLHGFVRR